MRDADIFRPFIFSCPLAQRGDGVRVDFLPLKNFILLTYTFWHLEFVIIFLLIFYVSEFYFDISYLVPSSYESCHSFPLK